MTRVLLIVLIGLPGSGKSTWARQFVGQHPTYRIVSTDAIRQQLFGDEAVQGPWPQIWQQLQAQLQQGVWAIERGHCQGVIYDATNGRRRHRRDAIALARHLGFDFIIGLWFDIPLAVCLQRNQMRSRHVPPAVIERMHRQLQGAPPARQEGFDRLYRTETGAERFQVSRLSCELSQ